jgi:AraC-like DNA-binding protein
MIHFNQPNTYEHIQFTHPNFPFGTYTIPNLTTLPHWHTHIEFIYAKKGTVDVYINGTQYPCHEGDIQFIPGNSLHSIIPRGHSIYTAIVIGDELLTQMSADIHFAQILETYQYNAFPIPFYFSSSDPFYPEILGIVESILLEDTKKSEYYQGMIKLEVCRFFTMINRYFPQLISSTNQESTNQTNTIKSSIEYLTIHFTEKITIANMSQMMNLSEQHYSRLFKAHTGKTFVEYLTLFRLEQAEKLLLHSDLPITQLPELTGFCNPNYFSRVYKKHFGQSPSKTRKARHFGHPSPMSKNSP